MARSQHSGEGRQWSQLPLFVVLSGGGIPSHYYFAKSRLYPTRAPAAMSRQSLSSSSSSSNEYYGDQSVENGKKNIMNGLYLDPETYLQAEETFLRPDGSLDLRRPTPSARGRKKNAYQTAVEGVCSPPPSYSYYPAGDDAVEDDDDGTNIDTKLARSLSEEEQFHQAVMEIENRRSSGGGVNSNPMMNPEALHQQVFAEEQAYLKQSEDFRNALPSLFDDNNESPMVKERRERIEQYNESVLSDLIKKMDEMAEMAPSREDAIMGVTEQAEEGMGGSLSTVASNETLRRGNANSCSKCGLRVTPDMIQRATLTNQREILCSACHGKLFVKAEAQLRVPASEFASSRIFDKKSTRLPSKNEFYNNSERRWNTDRHRRDGSGRRDSNIQGISTASLFDVSRGTQSSRNAPKDYHPTPKNTPIRNAISRTSSSSSSSSPPSSFTTTKTSSSDYRQQRFLRSSSSRILGGAELMKRMQQQESEPSQGGVEKQVVPGGNERSFVPEATKRMTSDPNRGMEQSGNSIEGKEGAVDVADEVSAGDGRWVQVEDPTTKRSIYWNTETGEMKKSE